MYEVCDICYSNVDMDYLLDHKEWHRMNIQNQILAELIAIRRLVSRLSPAPIREDHSGWPEGVTLPEHPDPLLSHKRDPVAERPDRAMTCDHDWPPDLDAEAQCTKCGIPYGQWHKETQ